MDTSQLLLRIQELETKLQNLETKYKDHQHDGVDGTSVLRKSIVLDQDQCAIFGFATHGTAPILSLGATTEQMQYSIGVGKDDGRTGFTNKVKNLQLNFLHQPNNTSKQSFITAMRDGVTGSISVSAGGNTATINGYNFVTDELAGAVINILNSSKTFIESQIISSNTDTEITIASTWGATTTGGSFVILFPVYFGSADTPYSRFYAMEGTTGGIRFGIGPTWTSGTAKNGLLYMDSTGDLYWRNKSGTSTKLN